MKPFQNTPFEISPLSALRFGLGMVFLYAGVYSLFNSSAKILFIPNFLTTLFPESALVIFFAIVCILLAVAFFSGFYLKLTSLISFFIFAITLIFHGISDANFRDFGLLTSSLAIFLLIEK